MDAFFSFFLNDTHILFIATLLDSVSQRKSSDDNIDNQDKYHLIDNKQTQVIMYIYSRKRKLGEILLKVNMKCKILYILIFIKHRKMKSLFTIVYFLIYIYF